MVFFYSGGIAFGWSWVEFELSVSVREPKELEYKRTKLKIKRHVIGGWKFKLIARRWKLSLKAFIKIRILMLYKAICEKAAHIKTSFAQFQTKTLYFTTIHIPIGDYHQ